MITTPPPAALSPALAAWIAHARVRAWGGTLVLLLDAFAPLSILGAQALYVTAPLASVFNLPDMKPPLAELAALLETPGGTALLRQHLQHAAGQHAPDQAAHPAPAFPDEVT